MVLAFHQPNFLPNPGFFYKMLQADVFVVITNIQFQKSEGWQRRHKISTADGDLWLTVPVVGSQNQLIKDVMINQTTDWQRKHRKALQLTYGRTKERALLEKLLALYEQDYQRLVDVNMAFLLAFKEVLGIKTRVVLDEEVGGQKHQLMVNVCQKYEADVYLSGMGGKDYMTAEHFQQMREAGVECRFVERDVTGDYPYSTVHYLLSQGRDSVKTLLEGSVAAAPV